MTPAVKLTEFQKESQRCHARFYLKKWSRQTGKTFDDMLAICDDMHNRRTQWVVLSRGERQSKKNIDQCAIHCRAYGAAAEVIQDTWEGDEGKYKSLEILLPNGSSVIGLPANPDTARGHSANVALDEFAFHKDSRKIWAALFPVITRGYRLRVSSTPQGKQNKFYELDTAWGKKADDPHYHTSKIDIYDAVKGGAQLLDDDGKPATPEMLKEALGDEDAWDQEYMVLYLDEATALLSYDLIAGCEADELDPEPLWVGGLLGQAVEMHALYLKSKDLPPAYEILDPTVINADALYLGMDIGRKRDLSVIWLDSVKDGIETTVAAIALRKVPFFIQRIVLFSLLAHPMLRRACLDQTGMGLQLSEEAVERFGPAKVECITFTAASKEILATGLKQKFDDRVPRIPAEVPIRNSLHSIKRLPTGTGHFRFDAERSDETGHGDYFWAKALASHANSNSGPPAALATQEPEERNWRQDHEELKVGAGGMEERRRGSLIFGNRSRES